MAHDQTLDSGPPVRTIERVPPSRYAICNLEMSSGFGELFQSVTRWPVTIFSRIDLSHSAGSHPQSRRTAPDLHALQQLSSDGVIVIEAMYDVSANVFGPVDHKAPPTMAPEPRDARAGGE